MSVGDEVRDRANMRGSIVELNGARALVAWSCGYTTWIAKKFLTVVN
jgi:hypothetical protein